MASDKVLVVRVRSRPWWLLGLIEREQEMVMHPPPDASDADVAEWAERVRETGASVRIEGASGDERG